MILIIIAIVAGTGFYVWHSKNQTDKTLSNASNTNLAIAKKTKTQSSSSTSTSNDQMLNFIMCAKSAGSKIVNGAQPTCEYSEHASGELTSHKGEKVQYRPTDPAKTPAVFEVKEWRVRSHYSDDIDLSYTMNKDGKTIAISSSPLSKLNQCIGAVSITRLQANESFTVGGPTAAELDANKDGNFSATDAHIGNYYYFVQTGNARCSTNDDTLALEYRLYAAVYAMMPGFEAY